MTENEKLRALLAEARVLCDYNVDAQGRRELRARIDAALAEPVVDPVQAWKDANGYDDLLAAYSSTITERDETRAEVERLRALFDLTRHQVADALGVDRGHGWTALSIEARQIQQARIKAEAERDKARAEVERLRYALKGMVNTCRLDCTAASHCGVCAIAFRALPVPEEKP